jgi:hypothetical protein
LADFGLSFPLILESLRQATAGALGGSRNGLPDVARMAPQESLEHREKLKEKMRCCEQGINEHVNVKETYLRTS